MGTAFFVCDVKHNLLSVCHNEKRFEQNFNEECNAFCTQCALCVILAVLKVVTQK